ncbi:helix-turn-helix transcriptional regulator [Kribbella sp. CA-247076]|uniref:helix-turn-helix transcriptional regulator n=1 Tax=Kribbella sp. CA-247076 TaxID=3239941 RepID=UPI003D89FEF5
MISTQRSRTSGLRGRENECARLEKLTDAVRNGGSQALVVNGDAGVGKSALLEYLAAGAAAAGCRVVRISGTQSEMELPFAGLQQLSAPLLGQAGRLPAPQYDALRTALGIAVGPAPDRLLVGLAVLGLLSEAAGERPLLCVVDDAHWLDRASLQVLGVTARRLGADAVGLVFAVREPAADLAGLPELELPGLQHDAARAVLESALPGPIDPRVRDLIVAETRGNPLALLELPRSLSPARLAGGFGLPGGTPLTHRIEDSFARRLSALPDQTQQLLRLAAADPSGDRLLVRRAADLLGIDAHADVPAVEAGLVQFGVQIRFRHPLARSAAYRSAGFAERRRLHAALADATDPDFDPDRRAWHRAAAAPSPDEAVAAELEHSAGRAQARGGLAAAAAFLERATLLTADPARHTERALTAAQASLQAGAFEKVQELLTIAETGPLTEDASARVDLLRGQVAFASGLGSDAPPLLLKAAKRLESLDPDLARETYLTAWMAALFAGRLAGAGDLLEVCRAARALPSCTAPRTIDLVLDGLTLLVTDGPAVAASALRRALTAFMDAKITKEEAFRWGWLAQAAASALWDDDAWRTLVSRQVRWAREAGAFDELPVMLGALGTAAVWAGEFATASALMFEADAICEVTNARAAPFTAMLLGALRGSAADVLPLIEGTIAAAEAGGQGIAVAYGHWAAAVLHNGNGRFAEALTAARSAADDTYALHISMWALPELIEAAVRTGDSDVAADALARLSGFTRAGGTDFGLGILARCRALLNDAPAAGDLYLEAIERLGRTRLRPELARAHLLYGEWLRRRNRPADARDQLRIAYDLFSTMGAAAFADRARRGLAASAEKTGRRVVDSLNQLTEQEVQIARLAADGKTNGEIGAQLYVSPRTVEWHLHKVYAKLRITSRRELAPALRKAT